MRTLAAAALLLPVLALADGLGVMRVNKGFSGGACFDFGEDVSAATMTARVYLVPPTNGVGGRLLFTHQLVVASSPLPGSSHPASWVQCIPLAAQDTAVPRAPLYGELDVVYPDGSNVAQQFQFAVEGK